MIIISFIMLILNRQVQLKKVGFIASAAYFATNTNIFSVGVVLVYSIQSKFLEKIYKFLVLDLRFALYSNRKLNQKIFLIIMIKKLNIDLGIYVQSVLIHMMGILMSDKAVDMKIMNHQYKITPETANEFGKTLGNVTWRTRHDVEKNKTKLENPSSLTEYQNGFPSFLTDFFNGFIETLQRKKYEILTRKRKQRGLSLKNFDTSCVNKITVFLTSMILNIAFPNTKIWLTHIMSSLCRNPKLHHSLYNILCIANVVSHTYRYERLLEKARQQVVSPESRLLRNTNIWNISVIDNIDFIEQTYAYGNIFDTTCRSVHATLRMIFQFTLPMQIQHCSPINIKAFNGNNLSIFGTSDFTNNLLSLYEEMFQNFLTTRADDWDADNILKEIAQKIPMGCKVPHPNIVILKPGDNPNCNVNVHNACDMYYGDVGIVNTGCLDIACDEAIFRRLISYKDDNIDKNVRPLLG